MPKRTIPQSCFSEFVYRQRRLCIINLSKRKSQIEGRQREQKHRYNTEGGTARAGLYPILKRLSEVNKTPHRTASS